MKLSDIISYKNTLEELTPLETAAITHDNLNPLLQIVRENPTQFTRLREKLDVDYKNILYNLDQFDQTIEKIKVSIQNLIEENEAAYFQQSSILHDQMVSYDTDSYILDRRLPIFVEVADLIGVRLQTFNDWRFPGMIIRPGREDWITKLVGFDPLYLVDFSDELLDPSVLRFNDQYQRRLRRYLIADSKWEPMMQNLPTEQFGFCLVYNFFNYKPIEYMSAYFKEIYNKMRPGGTVAFTFNNCDTAEGVILFENNFMCYTPARVVKATLEEAGFVLDFTYQLDAACAWWEIRKPGELQTIRGGQTLAKILYKDDNYKYTSEEQRNIRHHAADLNINTPNELKQMPIGQIVELIKQRTRN